MAQGKAICIRCGNPKPRALGKCGTCMFTPRSSEDMAKSLILSPAFDAGEDVIGQSDGDLADIGAQIRSGRPHEFNPAEVAHVAAAHDAARTVTTRDLVVSGIRWLGPPTVFLGGLLWLLSRR